MPGRWIRIEDIPTAGLTPVQEVELIARSLTDLAAAEALVLVHGTERGLARYAEAGGVVRQDEDGEPVIWCEV